MIYLISHGEYSDYRIDEVLEGPGPASLDLAALRADFDALKESGEFGEFSGRNYEKRWADLLVERYGFRRVLAHEMRTVDYSESRMKWTDAPQGVKPPNVVAVLERTRVVDGMP